jgi:hypothetical protein
MVTATFLIFSACPLEPVDPLEALEPGVWAIFDLKVLLYFYFNKVPLQR